MTRNDSRSPLKIQYLCFIVRGLTYRNVVVLAAPEPHMSVVIAGK